MKKKSYYFILFYIVIMTIFLVLLACGGKQQVSQTKESVSSDIIKSTLDIVKERGKIVCGVTTGVPGYAAPNSNNEWVGFDVDLCRAVSSAIFGDPDKVEYRPLTAKERFTALQSGEIDILSRVTTWTLTRDTELGLNFAGVNYYDGQGFIVTKKSGMSEISQLDGASICVQAGTTTELNLTDHFREKGFDFEILSFDKNEQAAAAFESGRCESFTSDQSQLAALRVRFANPDGYVVLSELISKEPLGPLVRHGDDQWFDIVKWSLLALINAEELNVYSSNVDSMLAGSNDPNVKRLLGTEGDMGKKLGLDNNWAYNIVSQIGNYGEIFDKHLGKDSPLQLSRGYNALWFNGGLQYGYPIR